MVKAEAPDFAAFIAQYTDEPPEVVEERVNKRLYGSQEARTFLTTAIWGMAEALRENDYPLIYKYSIDIGTAMLFGVKSKPVNLYKPIELGPKDRDLVTNFINAAVSMERDDLPEIKQRLDSIPEVLGSLCDEGVFDEYNQEALLLITGLAHQLKKSADPHDDVSPDRILKTFRKLAPTVRDVTTSILWSNRPNLRRQLRKFNSEIKRINK